MNRRTVTRHGWRLAACALLACGSPPAPRPPIATPVESLLADAANKLRQLPHQHTCFDTCCAGIPSMLVPKADGPQLVTPQAELRRIARSSDPLMAALALTWLARQNDPADLPLIAELAHRAESIPWLAVQPPPRMFWPPDWHWHELRSPVISQVPPTVVEGTTVCQRMWWDPTSLGAAALAAASHITGRAFGTPGEMRTWLVSHPDPRDTVDYWRAHFDQVEQAFARAPFLYLRLRLEGVGGADEPFEAHAWRHSIDEIVAALRGHGRAFVDVLDERDSMPPPLDLLDFAIDRYDALLLGDFASAWKSAWERMMSGSGNELLLDLVAILAGRSNNDATIIERTVERSSQLLMTYGNLLLLQAHLQRWPDQHASWFARLTSVEARRDFVRVMFSSARVAPDAARLVLKKIVTAASERGLMEVVDEVFELVGILDPTWRPPTSGIHLDRLLSDARRSATSHPPERPAPDQRRTMDAIRARVKTW